VLYLRVEWGLAEAGDARRFAARYLTPKGRLRAGARASLRRALAPWAAAHGLTLEPTLALFETSLERLAETARAGDLSPAALRERVYLGQPEA
jgi:hypothetical protein